MSRAALIEALRRKAAGDAAAIWQKAEADAENRKREAARSVEERRTVLLQQVETQRKRLEDAETAAAERKARELRVTAEVSLAQRLYRLALVSLQGLRQESPQRLFAALTAELPSRSWQRVRVNPADEVLARAHFPQAEVVCDEAIIGGMEVEADDGRIRVSNTLEARLQSAWPDILPDLIASVLAESSDHRPAA